MVPLIAEFALDDICPHLAQDRKQKPLWYFQQKESKDHQELTASSRHCRIIL